MDTVVSGFGLKAEGPLMVRFNSPNESLVCALVRQSDLVATLLLHAFRQAADGDLATNTEPVLDQNEEVGQYEEPHCS